MRGLAQGPVLQSIENRCREDGKPSLVCMANQAVRQYKMFDSTPSDWWLAAASGGGGAAAGAAAPGSWVHTITAITCRSA